MRYFIAGLWLFANFSFADNQFETPKIESVENLTCEEIAGLISDSYERLYII